MNHKRLGMAAVIIALVLVAGFVLSVPHTRDVVHSPSQQSEVAGIPTVELRDSFKKGLHTITGTLETPDACTPVTAEATLGNSASSTQRILVAISLQKNTGVCLQLPTRVSFSVTISAPARTPIEVTVNGSEATTSEL